MKYLLPFAVLYICLMPVFAAIDIKDPQDKIIVDGFLKHAKAAPKYLTQQKLEAQLKKSAEGLCWVQLKYLSMPLTAYRLTGDRDYLDSFVASFANFEKNLSKGRDGFLGWYGPALSIFKDPNDPNKKIDVMITAFRAVTILTDFVEIVQADKTLAKDYKNESKRYIKLMEEHLFKKWDARACFEDLGNTGGIYKTRKGLRDTKASLTQPHNKHEIIIDSCLGLYRITGNDDYMKRAIRLGVRFKKCLTFKGNHYEWNYWDPSGTWDVHPSDANKWKHWIGVEHKGGYYATSLSQAVELYQHGVVFDKTDIERFVNTQVEQCWNKNISNPQWARVDASRSAKYMKGAYMCMALSPYNQDIAEYCFGEIKTKERVGKVGHGWQGGVAAEEWIKAKYLNVPAAKHDPQMHKDHGKAFLAKTSNKKWYESLYFDIKERNYSAPQTPKH